MCLCLHATLSVTCMQVLSVRGLGLLPQSSCCCCWRVVAGAFLWLLFIRGHWFPHHAGFPCLLIKQKLLHSLLDSRGDEGRR